MNNVEHDERIRVTHKNSLPATFRHHPDATTTTTTRISQTQKGHPSTLYEFIYISIWTKSQALPLLARVMRFRSTVEYATAMLLLCFTAGELRIRNDTERGEDGWESIADVANSPPSLKLSWRAQEPSFRVGSDRMATKKCRAANTPANMLYA